MAITDEEIQRLRKATPLTNETLRVIQTSSNDDLTGIPNTIRKLAWELEQLRRENAELLSLHHDTMIQSDSRYAALEANLAKAREALTELLAYGLPPHIEAGIQRTLEELSE